MQNITSVVAKNGRYKHDLYFISTFSVVYHVYASIFKEKLTNPTGKEYKNDKIQFITRFILFSYR